MRRGTRSHFVAEDRETRRYQLSGISADDETADFLPDSTGIIAAWVIARGLAGKGVRFTARWNYHGRTTDLSLQADDDGRALVCGVPYDETATLSVGSESTTQIRLHSDRPVMVSVIQIEE